METSSRAGSCRSESSGFSVGLTGGIGSGKSAVAGLFAGLGAAIIDTDAIAHSLTAPGGAAIDPIRQTFGSEYVNADGALDRARMRGRIFHDSAAKARLEAILHPLIRESASTQALGVFGHAPYVVFVVPLLVESSNWRSRFDRLLVIDCSLATQETRVGVRSRLDAALVRRIIAQQASRGERLDAADDILVNDGPFRLLAPRVERLHRHYCDRARKPCGGL
jgi:dephospho-CoA kinase